MWSAQHYLDTQEKQREVSSQLKQSYGGPNSYLTCNTSRSSGSETICQPAVGVRPTSVGAY